MSTGTELYLIRHAIAEERGDAWPDDRRRPLSADGRLKMARAARGLVELDVRFDLLLTSPLVRTRQTAEIIAAAYERRPRIAAVESLAPEGACAAVLADLAKQAPMACIGLVGHEPNVGELAGHLLGYGRPLAFKKGAVCRIDIDAWPPSEPGTLRWFLTPAILRALA